MKLNRLNSLGLFFIPILAFLISCSKMENEELNPTVSYEREYKDKYEKAITQITSYEDSTVINLNVEIQVGSNPNFDSLLYEIVKAEKEANFSKYFNANFHFFEALKFAKRVNSKFFLAKIYHGLAINFLKENNNQEAILYYRKCIAMKNELVNENVMGTIFNDLGIAFFEMNELDSAKFYFDQSNVAFQKENYPLGDAIYSSNIGDIHFKKGEYILALEKYNSSNDVFMNTKHPGLIAQICYSIAKTYFTINQQDTALKFAKKSNENAIITKNLKLINDTEFLLSKIYNELGFYSKSIEHLNKSIENQKQINSQDLVNKIQSAKNGYDYELQKAQNVSQKKDIELKNAQNFG